jgi:CopG family nickel-responsive transcriptional regulator
LSDLVRFGVAMDRALLSEFDERIAQRGYENRSEALRDLVRADLTRAAQQAGGQVTATASIVLARRQRAELTRVLGELEPGVVVAQLELGLDEERALLLLVVRGPAGELERTAGRVAGLRGVLGCELTIACASARRHA